MKKIRILFYSLITSIAIISCDDDFLDLAPISQMTTGNFYQSSIQIDQALTGAYSDLNPLYDNMMIRAAIWRGDNSSQTQGYANNLELNISQYNENAGSEVSTDIWNTCYSIINRVNLVIQKSEGVVIARHGGNGLDGSFTLRKITNGVGVERIFPLHSPLIASFDLKRKGKVRRTKLNYLKNVKGAKAARIEEKR